MFESIFTLTETGKMTTGTCLLVTAVSLVLGAVIAWVYTRQERYSRNFILALCLLPLLVQAVVMMVNGNLGAGVATLGAFSLIRFRSVPGSAKEISCILLAMAIGLADGMGYVTLAALLTLLAGGAMWLFFRTRIGRNVTDEQTLKILIPEELDFADAFDDLFARYTDHAVLEKAKTVNLGSLYELTYRVRLRDPAACKRFLDEVRCRNGNLTVSCGRYVPPAEEL